MKIPNLLSENQLGVGLLSMDCQFASYLRRCASAVSAAGTAADILSRERRVVGKSELIRVDRYLYHQLALMSHKELNENIRSVTSKTQNRAGALADAPVFGKHGRAGRLGPHPLMK